MDYSTTFWDKKYLLTDSRRLLTASESIFFALQGIHTDGHLFINELFAKGVRHFVVNDKFDISAYPEAFFKRTSSPLRLLQELVVFHRNKFDLPVIGVTGSNGKTIIKEWLYSLLERDKVVVKSPKSFNSQLGVPLSVWEINHTHELGIFEAGISQKGEMKHIAPIIAPNIGLFSNIGSAHDKGFENLEEKIREKLKLFEHASVLIACADHIPIIQEAKKLLNTRLFTWGESYEADLKCSFTQQNLSKTEVSIICGEESTSINIPFIDSASIENCMHCVTCLKYLGYEFEEIQRKIMLLKGIPMRLELKQGQHNCQLIDDTYNNDLAGFSIALNFMEQHAGHLSRTVVLSDLMETGGRQKETYQQIAHYLKAKQVSRLVGVGEQLTKYAECFQGLQFIHYESTNQLLDDIHNNLSFKDEIVLIKGARRFVFEKIVKQLQKKLHGTRLEINLEALVHNLNFYRGLLKPSVKIMVMVKALAYGSSRYEVAALLQYHLVDYLGVAYTDEGVELRENGVKAPIMVLNPSLDSFDKILKYKLEPEIYSLELLYALKEWWEEKGRLSPEKGFRIQLNMDTGMHRLGFQEDDIPDLLVFLLENTDWLTVTGVFTHLAGADETVHNDYSKQQMERFNQMVAKVEKCLGYKVIKHALNSAGIVRFPESQMDMVRLGIGLYGVEATGSLQSNLQNISTLKTNISQIKHLKKGQSVGYSRKGMLSDNAKIATIGIGYADGYDRRFSNGVGKVLVNGNIAPVIGNVCMDMTMIDITGIEASVDDEVILFGENLSIIEQAKAIGTIPYEILTNVNERVRRIFYAS